METIAISLYNEISSNMNHSIGGLNNVDLTAGLCDVLDAIFAVALWMIYTELCPVKVRKATTKRNTAGTQTRYRSCQFNCWECLIGGDAGLS